jgi:hypothetical protein
LKKKESSFKKWYAKNRDDLLRRKRKRYRTDKEYREKKKKAARDFARKRKKEGIRPNTGTGEGIPVAMTLRTADGAPVKTTMYTITKLANDIGKSPLTLINWEKKGYIPMTPFRGESTKPRRLYSEEMIAVFRQEYVKLVVIEEKRVVKNGKDFYNRVLNRWMEWTEEIDVQVDWLEQKMEEAK